MVYDFFVWLGVFSLALWTFNNHLLVFHRLKDGEDPMKVLLVLSTLWVQVHELPLGLFSESIAKQLGHNDSFCQVRMIKGLEVVEMGRGSWEGVRKESWMRSDPILELNLEGDSRYISRMHGELSKEMGQIDMEHDSEESPIESGDGKKRPRKNIGNYNVLRVIDSLVVREERSLERAYLRGKLTDRNKNILLECPWFGVSIGYKRTLTYAEDV
ncbi:hypothetical protein Goarm_000397 [Gossypium armourianum]|uniref:DUF4283 domain-containing protein n=1 Tax=Gossypium armourianum TaxID=34283 RepID=A0A7J9KA09_9ROSI|nr:hypothetical protein [Gossypium armourianum]